mmetsp:Transcript_944/g.1499  ORF Transcript_944/g.1499 Transcript_944/m.1499 type:complete len:382 (+) Transcript_944:747-1892(+)
MVRSPMNPLLARRAVPFQLAGGITAQRRQGGGCTALLEVAAAPVFLLRMPRLAVALAVELLTATLFSAAAPLLLRHGPALLPVGEARVAVVDAASGMALTFHMGHVGMKVKATMPGVRAALLLRLAAEVLLHRGPAKEPVLEAFIAVIGILHNRHLDIDGLAVHGMRHRLVDDLHLPGLRDLDQLGHHLHPVLVDHLAWQLHRDDLGSSGDLVGYLLMHDVHLGLLGLNIVWHRHLLDLGHFLVHGLVHDDRLTPHAGGIAAPALVVGRPGIHGGPVMTLVGIWCFHLHGLHLGHRHRHLLLHRHVHRHVDVVHHPLRYLAHQGRAAALEVAAAVALLLLGPAVLPIMKSGDAVWLRGHGGHQDIIGTSGAFAPNQQIAKA